MITKVQETWDRAQLLFLAAADLGPEERQRFLADTCAENPLLRSEVESLLDADRNSTGCLAEAVESEASKLVDCQFPGDRLGAYRIKRELGRGGMGAVFLATRDDDVYQKEVAIKVVKRGMDTAEVLERFRYERQILANLDHPYIAHLYDGGTTPDGRPFFVMEYVEGQFVDTYCTKQNLDVKARLRIFLRICQAVAYAHRNLVVHRDLKPGNILVSRAGEPKLLDFGVAKLLGGNGGVQTAAHARLFTPEFASPEQVMGLPVTTATDIYSLGAVLFELLTGHPAHKLTAHTPMALDLAICSTEVRRPSQIAGHIDADVDNIVLMAMRKEPERRYPSADHLAADIERYLSGEPVVARQSSFLYRARKFARRHLREIAAGAAVAASLIAATAISTVQYSRAEAARLVAVQERSHAEEESKQAENSRRAEALAHVQADGERDEALGQRARAEQRVTDLIDLANRTLFDVHSSIESLPGAVEARRKIVNTTTDYLERLNKTAGTDPRVRLALSAAYYKVGMIQGDVNAPSLHDFAGAQTNFEKAAALLAPIYRADPNDPTLMLRWIEIESGLADLIHRAGRREAAAEAFKKLLPISEKLARLRPSDVTSAKQEALIHGRLANTMHYFDTGAGLSHANRQIDLIRDLMIRFPADKALKGESGVGLSTAASSMITAGELDRAAELYQQSIRLREELLAGDPNNSTVRQSLLVAYGNYAGVLGVPWSPNLGRSKEALDAAAKAVAIARAMSAADPKDVSARFNLSMSLSRLGAIESDDAAVSLAALQESIALLEPIVKSNPKSGDIAVQLATAREYAAYRLQSLGRMDEAVEQLRESLSASEPFISVNSSAAIQAVVDEEALALFYASRGDRQQALQFAEKAVAHAEHYAAGQATELRKSHLARSYFVLASVHSKFADRDEAQRWANAAMDLWKPVQSRAILALHRQAINEATALAQPPR